MEHHIYSYTNIQLFFFLTLRRMICFELKFLSEYIIKWVGGFNHRAMWMANWGIFSVANPGLMPKKPTVSAKPSTLAKK